jgi:cyclic pyranopterin phosphate synthase
MPTEGPEAGASSAPAVYAFEEIDGSLPLIPLAARRVLDAIGCKLSLQAWLSLPIEHRRRVVQAGAGERVDEQVQALLDQATPRGGRVDVLPEPAADAVPTVVARAADGLVAAAPVDAFGIASDAGGRAADRVASLDGERWRALRALDRYVLAKLASKPERLARACAEILGVSLTHLSHAGEAHMVDVGDKPETSRRAVASACVRTTREVLAAIGSAQMPKGDVLAVARIAGIQAAKRTSELVPLCHPVRTTSAAVEFEGRPDSGELRVRAIVEAVDRTGVEMEAMVAAAVASLTVYDMIKSADRWATIDSVRLESKSGGKSGDVARPAERR